MSCSFSEIDPNISCSDHYGSATGSSILRDCNNNAEKHLTKVKLINNLHPRDSQIVNEKSIILLSCGIDTGYLEIFNNLTICVKHRKLLGLEWRPKTVCCNINHGEISKRNVCDYRINFSTAISIIRLVNVNLLNPIYKCYIFGSVICRDCFQSLELLLSLKKTLLVNVDSVLRKKFFFY
jgi:hypothetical protein